MESSLSYQLRNNFENLTLTGPTNLNGTGNSVGNLITGNTGRNILRGGGGNDTLDGGAGNDTLVGGAGADTLLGGDGDDALAYALPDGLVDGGAGTDTLRIDGSGITLDLTGLAGTVIREVEGVNLTGSGNNTLTVSAQQVLDLSTTSNTLTVDGNAGDIVNAGSGWTAGLDQVTGANTYHSYTQNGATLLVDTDITQNITG